MRRWTLLAAVLLSAWLALAAGPLPPPEFSSESFVAEVDRLLAATENIHQRPAEIPSLLAAIPAQWVIAAEGHKFEISSEWLRGNLAQLQRKPTPEVVQQMRSRLLLTRAEVVAFGQPAADRSVERRTLNRILARNEFRRVQGPTPWERFKQRINRFLLDLLGRIFGSKALPAIARITVWALVALAVAVLAIWMYRSITRSLAMESITPGVVPVSAKPWTVWMAEARAAAESGDWSNAVHLAYWSGIAFLEMQGLWRPDRARTPREYLRVLPASSQHRAALTSLTRQFEVVWYGKHQADAAAFVHALAQLEKLGCRSL